MSSLRDFDLARSARISPNAKVRDGRQPPMTSDLSLSESARSRSLHPAGYAAGITELMRWESSPLTQRQTQASSFRHPDGPTLDG